MRIALILLTLLTPALADRFDRPIHQLSSEDAAVRKRARASLLWMGTPALPKLREAEKGTKDKEFKARLTAIIQEIVKREPHGLKFHVGMPKMRLTLDLVRGREFRYAVTVTNHGDKEVVLYPYLSLRVLDPAGKPVKYARHLGRGGRRRGNKNPLETIKFVTVKPGERWSFTESVAQYMHDPKFINGWQIPKAGKYTLEFTYSFDRDALKKRCDPDWELLDHPKSLWNRALTMTHTFRGEMKVKP
ncbi:MAG: hypothetical protein ACYTGZ_03035 [Planctomycetota bacterium]|jgi:hypothetical protein